jgi:hypothetical protein
MKPVFMLFLLAATSETGVHEVKIEATVHPAVLGHVCGVSHAFQQAAGPLEKSQSETSSRPRQNQEGRRLGSTPMGHEQVASQLTKLVAQSGRAIQVAESPSERLSPPAPIAPGVPPLLSFRYFEGRQRHRFGKLDLVMDDAGH